MGALPKPASLEKTADDKPPFCLWHSISFEDQYAHIAQEIKDVLARGESVIVMAPEKELQKRIGKRLAEDFKEVLRVQKGKAKVQEDVELFQELIRHSFER